MSTQTKREEENTTRIALAKATAEALGEGWTFEVNAHGVGGTLLGPDGEHVRCSSGWESDGRLVLAAEYPSLGDASKDAEKGTIVWSEYHNVRTDDKRSITVGLTRTPKAVASEIRRRLLPGYLERLPMRIAEADARLENYLEAEEYRAEIAKIIEPLGMLRTQYVGKLSTYSRSQEKPHTEWEIDSQLRYLKVELTNLSPDQMLAVANLVAKF